MNYDRIIRLDWIRSVLSIIDHWSYFFLQKKFSMVHCRLIDWFIDRMIGQKNQMIDLINLINQSNQISHLQQCMRVFGAQQAMVVRTTGKLLIFYNILRNTVILNQNYFLQYLWNWINNLEPSMGPSKITGSLMLVAACNWFCLTPTVLLLKNLQ